MPIIACLHVLISNSGCRPIDLVGTMMKIPGMEHDDQPSTTRDDQRPKAKSANGKPWNRPGSLDSIHQEIENIQNWFPDQQRTSNRLGYLMPKFDPKFMLKLVEGILDAMETIEVIKVTVCLVRTDLIRLAQDNHEVFRTFETRVRGLWGQVLNMELLHLFKSHFLILSFFPLTYKY